MNIYVPGTITQDGKTAIIVTLRSMQNKEVNHTCQKRRRQFHENCGTSKSPATSSQNLSRQDVSTQRAFSSYEQSAVNSNSQQQSAQSAQRSAGVPALLSCQCLDAARLLGWRFFVSRVRKHTCKPVICKHTNNAQRQLLIMPRGSLHFTYLVHAIKMLYLVRTIGAAPVWFLAPSALVP